MKSMVVLGMHRSATSLVSKGLHENNCNMGSNLLGPMTSNIFGHYEELDFVFLNDAILKEAGGSWDSPPAEDQIIEAGQKMRHAIGAIVKKHKKEPMWGWKDPRTTLTIRCYLEFLENPHFIVCFREPEKVAKSLYTRNRIPIESGLLLAGEYNQRLLDFLKDWG